MKKTKFILICSVSVIIALCFTTACNSSNKDMVDISTKSYDMLPYMLSINGSLYSSSGLHAQNKGKLVGKVLSVVKEEQVPTENYSTNCPLISHADIFDTEEGFLVESRIIGGYILFTKIPDDIPSNAKSYFVLPQDDIGS